MKIVTLRLSDGEFKKLSIGRGQKNQSAFIREAISVLLKKDKEEAGKVLEVINELKLESQNLGDRIETVIRMIDYLKPKEKKDGPTAFDLLRELHEKIDKGSDQTKQIEDIKKLAKEILGYVGSFEVKLLAMGKK